MKITDLLSAETIHLEMTAKGKQEAINELASILASAGRLTDVEKFKKEIMAREELGSTGVGDGIAIPHAKTDAVKQPSIVFGRSSEGVEYDALDGKPVHLFFMIAATEGANNQHLDTLARLASMLIDSKFKEQLLQAKDKQEVLAIIDQKEKEKLNEETGGVSMDKKKVVAVTACPTGIAHTYMAADSLKEKAKELGVDIKVETRGSGGAKNVLTAEDIREADAVIVAADTKVDLDRFKGKPVIVTGVTDGIKKPQELIEKALS